MPHSLPPEPLKATTMPAEPPVAQTPGYPAYDLHPTQPKPKVFDDLVAIPRIGVAWWNTIIVLILPYLIVFLGTLYGKTEYVIPALVGVIILWAIAVVNSIWEMIKYHSVISGISLIFLLLAPLIHIFVSFMFLSTIISNIASQFPTIPGLN